MLTRFVYSIMWAMVGSVTYESGYEQHIPKFYIDPMVHKLLVDDRRECLHNRSAASEINVLKTLSATEYFRSHELLAHSFFIESEASNPYRVYSLEQAEFEYIPLLSLYWVAMNETNTNPNCGYRHLVDSLLKVHAYITKRDKTTPVPRDIPRFAVASTFNLRTIMGTGMPTQIRKGEAWDNMSAFIMGLSIGHYERWPQCPDLLRKSFKYVIELPYISGAPEKSGCTGCHLPASFARTKQRDTMFFFSGNFELFGPEMVCSVRNEILNIASTRNDTLVVNSTASHAQSALLQHSLHNKMLLTASHSKFCLITKSDSYSTSFFYLAVAAGCVPVVISDWFVFAFPWLVPYEKFVIRIQENDFLQNPHLVLDYIASTVGRNEDLLQAMREEMNKQRSVLTFEPLRDNQCDAACNPILRDVYVQQAQHTHTSITKNKNTKSDAFSTYRPFEAMLLELRYNQKPHQYYNNIPCLRPTVCARNHILNTTFKSTETDYIFPAKSKQWLVEHTYEAVTSSQPTTSTSTSTSLSTSQAVVKPAGYSVLNDGYQVKPMYIPNLIDVRSHLCRHAMRLIGSYKIVFFMQCVRILWPLHPGTFKPVDNAARWLPGFNKSTFMPTVARYKGGKYSVEPDGISRKDMQFVVDFHNITKPIGYRLVNYPVTEDRNNIIPFSSFVF